MKKKHFISLKISTGAYNDFIQEIKALALKRQSSYVCIANVHMLVEAYIKPDFANVVNHADLVTPDGMPLAKGLKTIYRIQQDRVAGMDLLPDLLVVAQQENIPVFFYGGTTAMLNNTVAYLSEHYSELTICGTYSPPFRPLTTDEERNIIETINDAKPGLVFVVLGCPKQERWMASMKNKIDACMLGVGGALPVLIGMQKRAPIWMQKNNLEWLYRLGQEPKRLFKRYLMTNSIYIALFLKTYSLSVFSSGKKVEQ